MEIGKECTECKLFKPFDQFFKRFAMVDGHRSCCKQCDKNRGLNSVSKGMCRAHPGNPILPDKKWCQACSDNYRKKQDENLSMGMCPRHKDVLLNTDRKTCQKCIDGFRNRRGKNTLAGMCRNHPFRPSVLKGACKECSWENKVRNVIHRAFSAAPKKGKTAELLGCEPKWFRNVWLVSKFKAGMTLENHGTVWEIDHIRPIASFDLSNDEDVRMACNYQNLQPLFKSENRLKRDRWEGAK